MFAIVYVALGRTKGTLWQSPPRALAGKVAAMSYFPPRPQNPCRTYVLILHQQVFARNKIRAAKKQLEECLDNQNNFMIRHLSFLNSKTP